MKNIFLSHFSESKIKPRDLYKKWKNTLEKDLSVLFPDKKRFINVNCPGCKSHEFELVFDKFGFKYQRCNICNSLFVSPRPTAKALKRFYQKAPTVNLWGKKITEFSIDARRRHQLLPLYRWLSDLVKEYQPKAKIVVDYEPRYFSLFLSDKSLEFEKIIFVNPLALKNESRSNNIKRTNNLGRLKEKCDIFAAFDSLDREFDPINFIKQANKTCRKGGLLLLTANTISGFEYQILGKNSDRLVPPDRLNLLSTEAIYNLLTKNGFQIIDLSTPGKLDVEIVANTFKSNSNIDMPEFLKYMFKYRSEDTWESFQDFLQLNKLSSYLRIAAVKK